MFYQYQHFGTCEYFCKEYGKNFNFPKHCHGSFEFITVLSGEMDVGVGERTYTLRAGEAVLIFPNQIHSLRSSKSEHMLVIFSPDIVSAYYTRYSGMLPVSNRFSVAAELMSQISSLQNSDSIVKLKAVLYSICACFDEFAEYSKRQSSENDLLSLIFDFVENHFLKDCSLEVLSISLGYSTSYLSRYFKSATEMSYVSFVNKYKVSKVCYLLTNSNKTILECAMDCGYTSLRSFNRNFKIHTGVVPKEYRESGGSQESN